MKNTQHRRHREGILKKGLIQANDSKNLQKEMPKLELEPNYQSFLERY